MHSSLNLKEIIPINSTIACVGASNKPHRASFGVARYMRDHGFRVIPINPSIAGQRLHGEMVLASLTDIRLEYGPIRIVNIFRKSSVTPDIVQKAITALSARGLSTIWMQEGVVNEDAARIARAAGLNVVMDRCIKVAHQQLFA